MREELPVSSISSLPARFRNRRRSLCNNNHRRRRESQFKPQLEALEGRRLLAAAIFEVTNTADDGDGSLREAIEAANVNPGADTIKFARGIGDVIELTSGQLTITDDLTIKGPGSDALAVSGGGASRVFAVLPADLAENPFTTPTLDQVASSPTVTIKNLAINDGFTSDAPGLDPLDPENPGFAFGGGLYNLGGTVHLDRVHMSNNVAANAVTAGGAVANEYGGTLTVSRSSFESNTSAGGLIGVGGAITSDLGIVIDLSAGTATTTNPPEVSVDRSSFVGNTASAFLGYIKDVEFSGLGAGGAILNVTGIMSISRSHFEANAAEGGSGGPDATLGGPAYGGAINTGDFSPFGDAESQLEVSRSTFVENTATAGDGSAVGMAGGQAGGGAISVGNLGDATLSRNHFTDNSVSGGAGGTDAAGGTASGGGVVGSGGAALTLQGNHFVGNGADGGVGTGLGASAAGRGGGLALESVDLAGFVPGPATAEVTRDTYHGNTAVGAGGGIFNDGDLSLRHSRLSENTAEGNADVLIDFYPGYLFQGGALGGGLSNIGTLDVDGTTFHANRAVGGDGATGPILATSPAGTAPTYPGLAVGGGLHNLNEATVDRSRFSDNEAIGGNQNVGSFAGIANGGGVYNDSSLVISNSSVSGNRAVGGDVNAGDINVGGAAGGGISSGSVTALPPLELRSATLDVNRVHVRSNEAIGGEENQAPAGLPTANAAGGAIGGGILVYQGSASISRAIVTHNTAIGGSGAAGSGGGIFAFAFVGSVNVEVSRSIISHNAAIGGDGRGGGLAAGSLGSLSGGTAELTVARSLIFGNLAEGDDGDGLGGGIFNDADATLELAHSLVFRNRAVGGSSGDGIGGGLYNNLGGTAALIRSRIFANLASTSDDDCFGC